MKAKREDIETQEIYPLGNALDLVSSMAHFRAVHLLNNHGDELSKRFGNMADAITQALAWDLSALTASDARPGHPTKDGGKCEASMREMRCRMESVTKVYEELYLKWRDAYNDERIRRNGR